MLNAAFTMNNGVCKIEKRTRRTVYADGTLKSVATYSKLPGSKRATKVSERRYIGAFVFEGDSLAYVNTEFGYFDGEGNPHYRHADFQGNITMVTDRRGQQYGPTNPYVYCAANPIKYIDPTGCANIVYNGAVIGNDGKDDGKTYLIPDPEGTTYEDTKSGISTKASGYSNAVTKKIVDFMVRNIGNDAEFDKKDIEGQNIYEYFVNLEINSSIIQDFENDIEDNGRGGERENNNKEYSGFIDNGKYKSMGAGKKGNPKSGFISTPPLPIDKTTLHTHSSGTTTEYLDNGESNSYHYIPFTSREDMQVKRGKAHFVYSLYDENMYIYDSNGIRARVNFKRFKKLFK